MLLTLVTERDTSVFFMVATKEASEKAVALINIV